jgi:DNA-binding transcriptional ArsR family regulator
VVGVDALQAVGDPVRRRLVELLAAGPRSAGELSRVVGDEFGITQPAASRHLRLLRESEVVASRVAGTSRVYSLNPAAFDGIADWAARMSAFWEQRLDALETELARGAQDRRGAAHSTEEQR